MRITDDGSNQQGPVDYGRLEPVDREQLRHLGIDRDYCARFAIGRNSVELGIVEFFRASHDFPIAFTRNRNRVSACAVLGLADGQNLFVDARGNWREGVYIPAYIRRFPFVTGEIEDADDDQRKPVYVDRAALDPGAEALFDANGEATPGWRRIETFIGDYLAAERATRAFTRRLDEFDLLEPFDARVYPKDAEPIRLAGLFRIDENRLNALPARVLHQFMRAGELSRIYAHLISLDNFAKLLDLSTLPDGRSR